VSRSDVVTNMRPSFSLSTLLILSRAASSCADASQLPSLAVFDLVPLPRPRAAGADADFSSALVSTADMVHRRRKPYISKICLWCGSASCSSASMSAWTESACVDRAETIRSRILPSVAGGICAENLDFRKSLQSGSMSQILE
jgi:hypothetical protein